MDNETTTNRPSVIKKIGMYLGIPFVAFVLLTWGLQAVNGASSADSIYNEKYGKLTEALAMDAVLYCVTYQEYIQEKIDMGKSFGFDTASQEAKVTLITSSPEGCYEFIANELLIKAGK